MKVQEVSRGAYARLADGDSIYDGWGANQGFVTTRDGTLVVDSGFTAQAAKGLLAEMRKRKAKNARILVNTHDHSDHVFGNSLFESSSLIVAHANCRRRLIELGSKRIATYRRFDARLKSSLKGLTISPPVLTYQEEMEFELGGTVFRLLHPKVGAHTSGDTMVLLPEQRILFAGDVLWVGYHPNLEDANIGGWLDALEAISRMRIDLLVPGHGQVADKASIAPLASYLRDFDRGFTELVREGVPKDRISLELESLGARDWKLKTIVERNVDLLYRAYAAKVTA